MAKGGSNGKSSSAVGGGASGASSAENQNSEAMGGAGASNEGFTGNAQIDDSLLYYGTGDGTWVNSDLRRGNTDYWSESDKQYVKDLDKATSNPISNDTLYRGVAPEAIFGENMSFDSWENLQNNLMYGARDGSYGAQLARQAENIKNSVIGKEITDKGFMSTSTSLDSAKYFGEGNVIMKIKTNGKAKGIDLSKKDTMQGFMQQENEVLLKRNTKFKVNNIYAKDYQVYVDVTLQ